ncbi:MAG: dockerin type I repeat-containing protein, partial [Muribaculaceae bacterium]|nr:dockerin type I repeat-containing protein [Muribaculaceae bacterium]
LLGDVNGDGNVNISDVTALIDYLLYGNASGINLTSADANQDSSINISDVTVLIDYLLSGTWN